ncbi:hypothetical protein COS86_05230 [Candidatus Bathyarchaeota archaeon CG07_land_8_20_14_0_80_47_9]|nr:MAG: hypothetical protein COS86_05230 [Candidatus Bathyarchaeota archaeon CG07_land_8_20_14_0_80_47_9]
MDLEMSKNLGGIGALLLVISGIGMFGTVYVGLLGLIGIILVLIAMKGLSDYYKEGGIFNNALYGFIVTIVGGLTCVGVMVVTIIMAISTLGITDWTDWAMGIQQNAMDWNAMWSLIGPIIWAAIAALVVLFIFAIIAVIFYRKSLSLLSKKSGVNMFETTGLLLLIGAILTIILVGFILIWIAGILLTVAFFSIRPQAAQQPATAPPPPPPQ